MSRCPSCKKKPYDCHCTPLTATTPDYWFTRGVAYQLVDVGFGKRTLIERDGMPPRTDLPTPHLFEKPPEWNGGNA